MAKRKFLNLSALIDGDPVGLPVPPLPPIVKLWAYRMLVELGQAQSILASGTYRQDGLLHQLGLGHLLSQEDEDQRNRSVMKAMLQMHAEAERSALHADRRCPTPRCAWQADHSGAAPGRDSSHESLHATPAVARLARTTASWRPHYAKWGSQPEWRCCGRGPACARSGDGRLRVQ